jgi:hypothetical protein
VAAVVEVGHLAEEVEAVVEVRPQKSSKGRCASAIAALSAGPSLKAKY